MIVVEKVSPSAVGLRAVGLLANASEEVVQRLCADCVWRRYRPGEEIVAHNARDCDVYFIIAGSVRATAYSASGREVTYRVMHAGEWFGDFAAIDNRPRSAAVVAQTESLIASLRADHFTGLLAREPAISDALILHLVGSVRELSERLFALSTMGVEGRVDAEILRLARDAGVTANRAVIRPAPTHADLASRIGTSREQVTRECSRLASAHVLERARGVLIVLDVAGLEARVRAAIR